MPEPTTSESHTKPHEGWVLVDPTSNLSRAGRIGQIIRSSASSDWTSDTNVPPFLYDVRFPDGHVFVYLHDELSKWTVA